VLGLFAFFVFLLDVSQNRCERYVRRLSKNVARSWNIKIMPLVRSEGWLAVAALFVVAACAPRAMTCTAAISVAIHLYCRIFLGGYTIALPLPKASLARVRRASRQPSDAIGKPIVVVTGGAGMLGHEVTRRLCDCGHYRVVVVDLCQPSAARVLEAVEAYHVADLAQSEELDSIFAGAAAVVHTAGLVDLTADTARTWNAHCVATARVMDAAERQGVRAVVLTSSIGAVTSPYVTHPQMDLPADYLPPGHDSTFPHHSSYGATKLQAEQSALRRHMPGRLGVCALRMPMIFGIDDPLVVAPLLSGALDRVPDMPGPPLVEFCYVENAAAAHVAALAALISEEEEKEEEVATSSCRPRVGGRAFNVTNGDAPQSAFALWDALARKAAIRQRELGCPPPHLKPLRRLPFGLLLGLACASEFVFALCCGHVPRRRATFWNLTRASLRLSCTTVTQSLAETQRHLGWTPEFTTLQAFDHMLRGWRPSGPGGHTGSRVV